MSAADVVTVDLTSDQRFLLRRGLAEWGGPAHSTDELARVMGFQDRADLYHGEGRARRERSTQLTPA
ncbi:hypothetical protein, partial [Micromonospora aurantiaca (nom. illeg.)]|uniref:hypothetical protein n=1 Tax=Micromonospora aurantiaca (nom. illeg.) TaxID=47850 RepID=UPI0035B3BA4A